MFIVIAYDVVENDRRTRLSRLLCDFGRRVQKSVFECVLSEKEYLDLKFRLDKEIDHQVDTVRYYHLCQRCVPAIEFTGVGTSPDDGSDDVIIV